MKQKFWIVLVVLLLLINSAMIIFMWTHRPGRQQPPPHGPADDYLRKELSLTPAQQKQFETARQHHFENMQSLLKTSREKRDAMFDEISNPASDTAQVNQLAAALTTVETRKEVLTVQHFKLLRSYLDKTQQEKFDKIFKTILRMMSGPPRPGMERNGPPAGEEGPPPQNDSIHH